MKKFKVFINGHKTIMAETEDQALELVEKEYLQYSIGSLNLDISGIETRKSNDWFDDYLNYGWKFYASTSRSFTNISWS